MSGGEGVEGGDSTILVVDIISGRMCVLILVVCRSISYHFTGLIGLVLYINDISINTASVRFVTGVIAFTTAAVG